MWGLDYIHGTLCLYSCVAIKGERLVSIPSKCGDKGNFCSSNVTKGCGFGSMPTKFGEMWIVG